MWNWRALMIGSGLALALAGWPQASDAQDRLQQVLDRGKLIVGTGSTNPPWHFKDEQDNFVGFDIDVAKIIAKGIFDDPEKVEFVTQGSDARIPNLATDKVDITCQFMTVTAGRAQQVNFTITYYREGVGLLMLKDGKYKSIDDLKTAGSDVTVSVLQNVYAEEMVHKALPEATVDQYDSVDLMYQALNSNRADAAATDMSSLRWFILQNKDRYVDAGYGWEPQTYSCAVKKGDLEWLHFVNTVLREAQLFPWHLLGLPLALVSSERVPDAAIRTYFLDRASVARPGGLPRPRTRPAVRLATGDTDAALDPPGAGTPSTWRARVDQFAEHIGAFDARTADDVTALASRFRFVPPAGFLPRAALELLTTAQALAAPTMPNARARLAPTTSMMSAPSMTAVVPDPGPVVAGPVVVLVAQPLPIPKY